MTLVSTHVDRSELGSGRFREEIHLRAIGYRRDGSLRRIGNMLAPTGASDWPIDVEELCTFRVAARIAGKSPLVHFGSGANWVRFALAEANNVAGVVAGNRVTFPNAWNGADLEYVLGGHRLYEYIRLRAGHPRSFAFTISEHTGFDPNTLDFGAFRILDPVLEPPAGSDAVPVALRWIVSQQGGRWQLTVTLPDGNWAGWTIDPTLTLQPGAADGVDNAIISTQVNTNYGSWGAVYIGNSGGGEIDRTLIKFDLSSLPDAALLSSATFSLYAFTQYSSSGTVSFTVYRQKRAWIESQSTWNIYSAGNNWQTAGGFGAGDCEQAGIGSRIFAADEIINEFKDWLLTPTTKAALDLGNGWLVKSELESTLVGFGFASSDYATANWRPRLVIDYTLPGGGGIFASSIFHSAIHGRTIAR